MHILVSAKGEKDSDFSWTNDRELVFPVFSCGNCLRDPEAGCGCGRSFMGIESGKLTTTAVIVDSPITEDLVTAEFVQEAAKRGWPARIATEWAEEMLSAAARFAVGDVVERRLDVISTRELVG
ncbi:hypothetical protein ACFVAJ_18730 [Agromyces sp. NPDC057679]|uniref:DUF7715 family protein n=1 Tax=Agromyces sp. NPDC057679 TaxID=3346207 RepID=UPI0036708E4F